MLTFRNVLVNSHIYCLLIGKVNRELHIDCEVILGENITSQHKLLVMDMEIQQ